MRDSHNRISNQLPFFLRYVIRVIYFLPNTSASRKNLRWGGCMQKHTHTYDSVPDVRFVCSCPCDNFLLCCRCRTGRLNPCDHADFTSQSCHYRRALSSHIRPFLPYLIESQKVSCACPSGLLRGRKTFTVSLSLMKSAFPRFSSPLFFSDATLARLMECVTRLG